MKFSEINASQINFWIKGISGCENVLSKIKEFMKPQKKNHAEHFFFQFFMLNISPIKELLHKPAKIQTNIAGVLE